MPSSQRDDFARGGLALLDAAFHPLHAAIILLSTLGWVFPPTRRIGLAIQVLVLFCWFGLGWFRRTASRWRSSSSPWSALWR